MLRRNLLLLVLASIFVISSAKIEYEENGEDWVEQESFNVIMSWYLKRAYAATVQIIHSNSGDTTYHRSSRFIAVIHKHAPQSVVITRHAITAKDNQNSDRRPHDGYKHPANKSSAHRLSGIDLSKKKLPELFFHWKWQNLTTYGDCMTILLIPDEKTFQAFLNSGGFWRRKKVKLMLIILIPETPDTLCQGIPGKKEWANSAKNILRKVWSGDKVLNIFLSAPTSPCIKDYLFSWNPFATDTNGVFGTLKRLKINADDPGVYQALSEFAISVKNMNGYPLKVTIFERLPTVMRISDVRPSFKPEHNRRLNIDKITGMDGLILKTLSSSMNYTVELSPPSDGMWYGYRLLNGTFVGMIGDIIYRRVDFAANGVFLKDYQTNAGTDFTIPIGCESICIAVPRAGTIPQWLQIFQCFSTLVWNLLLLNVLVCGVLRHILRKVLREQSPRRSLLETVIETALIFVSSPQNLPKLRSDRILVGFYLLFSVIVVGSFQGTLYEGFTSPHYYRDIDTLDALDTSGLPIGTGSRNLLNIFGEDDDSPTLTRLRHKVQVIKEARNSGASINRAAWKQDMAAIERKNDLELSINTQFLNEHGGQVLHIVEECPRTYHLTFMVSSGAFFLRRMNELLRCMVEAGLVQYWYNSTVNQLITKSHYAMAKKLQVDSKAKAFDLKNLQISFIVLITGLIFSILVFASELTIFRFHVCPKAEK